MAKGNSLPQEQKKDYLVVKDFKGVNTKSNRTAIDETEFAWLENIIPIGFANLKAVNTYTAVGALAWAQSLSSLATASLNLTNGGTGLPALIDYVFGFQADGSAQYVNANGNGAPTMTTLAAAGTFSASGIQTTTWKSQYLVIMDPAKGLFTFDPNVGGVVRIGSVGLIAITAGGTGYTVAPDVVISAPNDANGVQATAIATVVAGAVTSITLTNAGTGYTNAAPITVTILNGGGASATAIASLVTFATGTVSAVNITKAGSGYTTNFSVAFSGGGGSGAAGTAIVAGGQVTKVVITNPGSGYTSTPTVSLVGGGGTNATGLVTVNLSPNVAVSAFSGRLWLAAGRQVFYSSAIQFSDFITVSAGNIILIDNTLYGNITQMVAANNFLYVFGADSINVFSDVSVNGTSGITQFTNTNVSASIGTALPSAIFSYYRSVLFMNNYGVFALVGATTSKVSDQLDGIFPLIDFTKPVTSGQVLINNIICAAFNFSYTDPVLGARYIQAVYFEKKWFFTSQTTDTKYICSVTLSGVATLYSSNGTTLLKLFSNSTGNVPTTIQSALWSMGDPGRDKQAIRIGIEATVPSTVTAINVTVDNENRSSPAYLMSNAVNWQNNSLQTLQWTNNSSQTVPWTVTGYFLYTTVADQYGKYLGMTITSVAPGFTINGFQSQHELRAYSR